MEGRVESEREDGSPSGTVWSCLQTLAEKGNRSALEDRERRRGVRLFRRLLDAPSPHERNTDVDRRYLQRPQCLASHEASRIFMSKTREASRGAGRKSNQDMALRPLARGKKGGVKNGSVFGFFDESGFADRPFAVRTWSMRGQTPVIRSRGGWKRVTAAGMITFSGRTKRVAACAWLFKRGMRKEKALAILRDLKRRFNQSRLILLWDGLPAHRAKVVRTFIEENWRWLTVYRFPAYAPELNPQEFVWSAVKRKDMGNYCPKAASNLRARVYRALKARRYAFSFLKGCINASGLFSVKELGEGQ